MLQDVAAPTRFSFVSSQMRGDLRWSWWFTVLGEAAACTCVQNRTFCRHNVQPKTVFALAAPETPPQMQCDVSVMFSK